ncbi:potassium channel family protein [Kineothrix sedimenti]|uniref:TrkA family potassium uptake protein n=1 Tax=Kineothrix sedimenti TaxID=3123317 RepID=A0ABZ3EQK0_9FIRM
MPGYKSSIAFGVIGLGRFGYALAKTLSDNGKEVLVLDNNESKVKQIQDKVQQAFVIDQLDKPTLEEAGIQNCGTVIVCIGEHIEASILTTLNVIELGVPRVIAKAISAEHGRVLQKIGAEVVYPERERAIRLANSLTTPRVLDYIDLSNQYSISEIRLTEKLHGKTIFELNFRKKFGLNIIAIVRGNETIIEITPDLQLTTNDWVAVVGTKDSIIKFERYLTS